MKDLKLIKSGLENVLQKNKCFLADGLKLLKNKRFITEFSAIDVLFFYFNSSVLLSSKSLK